RTIVQSHEAWGPGVRSTRRLKPCPRIASACSGTHLYQPIPYLIYLKDNMDGGTYFNRSALVFLHAEIKNYHSDFHHSRDKAHTFKVNYISTTRRAASPFSNLSKPSLISSKDNVSVKR